MDRPRVYVDFNELQEANLVLLAKADDVVDSSGIVISLIEGMPVHLYSDDLDQTAGPRVLVADGVVERNISAGWASPAKWCCRIDSKGIRLLADSEAG